MNCLLGRNFTAGNLTERKEEEFIEGICTTETVTNQRTGIFLYVQQQVFFLLQQVMYVKKLLDNNVNKLQSGIVFI